MLTKEDVQNLLPNVGDVRRERPTVYAKGEGTPKLKRCQVIEVNREHLWYRVRFADGIVECYKLPETTWTLGGARV